MQINEGFIRNYNIIIHSIWWDRSIDITTLVWMLFFVGSMTGMFGAWAEIAIWITFPIFVLDLVVAYLRVRNFKLFLKKHWFTILITIPWLRVFRVARALRVFRATRGVKGVRAARAFKMTKMAKSTKTLKLAKSSKSLKIAKSMKQTTKLSKASKFGGKSSKFKKLFDVYTYVYYFQSSGEFYANSTRFLNPLIRSKFGIFFISKIQRLKFQNFF